MKNMFHLQHLVTESANPASSGLSAMSIAEQIDLMNAENQKAVLCLESQTRQIERVIEKTSEALQGGGRLVYMGAGTSGMIGLMDALECPPTFGVPEGVVIGLLAGKDHAFSNADVEDSRELGKQDLEAIGLNAGDIVIGLAASGRTPYVLGGLAFAQEIGASTAAVVCNPDTPIARLCPDTIEAVAGPEVLTGSTRLKAGTATKLVVNMISTLSMVRLGKVYKNYMVDVQLANEKLIERGVHIVCETTGFSKEKAKETLVAAHGHVKSAVVMGMASCTLPEAERYLAQAGGSIDALLRQKDMR